MGSFTGFPIRILGRPGGRLLTTLLGSGCLRAGSHKRDSEGGYSVDARAELSGKHPFVLSDGGHWERGMTEQHHSLAARLEAHAVHMIVLYRQASKQSVMQAIP